MELGTRPRTQIPTDQPSQREWHSEWVEALDNRRSGDFALAASIAPAVAIDADGGGWIRFESEGGHTLYLKPMLVAGGVPPLCDQAGRPDAALAAAAMGEMEALIGAVERIAGATLHPVEVTNQPHASVRLAIEASDRGIVVHRALLALPPGLPPAGSPLPLDPAFVSQTIPPLIARTSGPAVARAALAEIATGDLLLLGTGPLLAHFTLPDQSRTLVARVDVQARAMIVERSLDEAANRAPGASDLGTTDRPRIATVVEIDGTGLSHGQLVTLADGDSVPILAALGATLPVRLRAAGRAIAAGQLVAVGEGHGMLVTERLPDSVMET